MRESHEEENSSTRESIEREIDHCTVYSTHSTVHSKEKRESIQIRMRKSIHDAVGNYCGKTMTYGQFYEEAAILFMDINPKDGMLLVVEKPNKEDSSLKDKMLELILIPELERWVESTRDFSGKIHPNKLKTLYKIIEKSTKIYNKSEKMQSLLEEAVNLVE